MNISVIKQNARKSTPITENGTDFGNGLDKNQCVVLSQDANESSA